MDLWVATYAGFATGSDKDDVIGHSPNDKYLIADFGGPSWPKWRVLQIQNGITGK